MTSTKIEDVADALFDALFEATGSTLNELKTAMDDYEASAQPTYRRLRRIPAFATLWGAMREAIEFDETA
jgi:hypothetical protein